MTSPLTAWLIVVVAVSMSGAAWLISAPIVQALYLATSSYLPEEAEGIAMTLRLEFMIIPIIIDCLLTVWAYLVTTRRQAVIQGGYY
jgi:hypothetical protein